VAGESYTGEALRDALKAGTLEKPRGSVELVGMVKESDDESSIAFTPRGCDTWVDIPTSMIEGAQHVGHRRCDDHSHPVFRITLKEPEGDKAKVFSALLASTTQARAPSGLPPSRRRGPTARRRSPFGGGFGPPRGGQIEEGTCEQICEAVYAACFRSTEGMEFDDWVTLCGFEYELCMAGCTSLPF
jgi:hypothetical protein